MSVNPAPRLAVTTSVDPTPPQEAHARRLAVELNAPLAPRRNLNLTRLFAETGAARLLVVQSDRLLLRDRATDSAYFFHPNLALVRGGNLLRGQRDLYIEAAGLGPGDQVLDCTLGFAGEAALASFRAGPTGQIVGLESVPELAAVTREGLQSFSLASKPIEAALRRIEVVTADYRDYLLHCPTRAYDVVYFDPFFEDRLPGSEVSVSPLHVFGDPAPLDERSVREARRAARRCVVIKHPRTEPLPLSLAIDVTRTVSSRKSRLVYSVLTAY